MRKLKIAILTRTVWNEFPRMRHQLALLLAGHGHQVTFFEKPDHSFSSVRKISENLTVVPMPEIIHHQLRPFRFISDAANYFPKKLISLYFLKTQQPDIIINFNYYFYFLKDLFPEIPLCSFINDDFVAQGKAWMKKSIAAQLQDTCESSDAVLTVSYPLLKKLSEYNQRTFLFFPWAEKKYSFPDENKVRNVVLYFGHINHRLDFKLLADIVQAGEILRLVGPVQRTVDRSALKKLLHHKNVSLCPPSALSAVDFGDVCCSILPYDLSVKSVNACSISNRSFNLLSRGIPLIAPALPDGLKVPTEVISYCGNAEQFLSRIQYFKTGFYDAQEKIEKALEGNNTDDRYEFLSVLLEKLTGQRNFN